ncbi:MAG: hypothetical protein FWG79_02250 [Bacteroidales bacterium]|nr:hypothetical protein [Bacteroidales bacterium]
MKKNIYLICCLLIGIPFNGFSQREYYDDDEDFKFITISLAGSGFFAGKHVANYYNGRMENVNKLSYAWRNIDFVNAVKEKLKVDDFEVYQDNLPAQMRYKPAAAVSFRAAINLSPYTSVFLNVNQVTLIAADIFTIDVGRIPGTSEPILHQGKIWGKESRTMLDVGFQWTDDLEAQNWQTFYELAFNITNTKVRENNIEIEGLQHSIMDQGTHLPGQGFSTIALPERAFGVGITGSFGWRYVVNSYASLDFGATAYLQDINLTGYKKFHLNFNIFARLNLLMY